MSFNYKSAIIVIFIALMTGCSALSSIASYTVTESEIRTEILKHIDQLSQTTRIAGIPVDLSVTGISVVIGPNGRDVVALEADATASVSVFGLRYPAKVKIGLEGRPLFDNDEKAVYVSSLTLTHSEIDAGGFRGNLALLAERYKSLISRYLGDVPVYKLDVTKPGLAWLNHMDMLMTVEPGKIIFKPGNDEA